MVTTRHTIGLSISAQELCAVLPDAPASAGVSPSVWRAPLDPLADNGSWPSLAAALRELAHRVPHGQADGSAGSLCIALLSPLVDVRTIDVPPLRDDELQALLARNGSRYFVSARGPQIIAANSAGRRNATPEQRVVAAASARLIAAIHAAARESGWAVTDIVPAESAWLAAVATAWPTFARQMAHVVITNADRTTLLDVRDGQLVSVRRFRGAATDAGAITDAIREGDATSVARVGVIGADEARGPLVRAMASMGMTVSSVSADVAALASQPDASAAAFVHRARALRLRTDEARAQVEARARRIAMVLGTAAVALLAVAAGLELWGVRRELHTVQEQRAALKPKLSVTLVGRTTVEAAYRELGALNTAERAATQWSTLLAGMASHLNADAYLTTFRARGDSVIVEGLASHAATVFTDLAHTPGLVDVRAAAPVRREAPHGAEATERFTIAARAAAGSSANASRPTGAAGSAASVAPTVARKELP